MYPEIRINRISDAPEKINDEKRRLFNCVREQNPGRNRIFSISYIKSSFTCVIKIFGGIVHECPWNFSFPAIPLACISHIEVAVLSVSSSMMKSTSQTVQEGYVQPIPALFSTYYLEIDRGHSSVNFCWLIFAG